MTDMLDKAVAYLLQHDDACGNENCIGYEARDMIMELAEELGHAREEVASLSQEMARVDINNDVLLAEVERLTEDIDTLHRECARLYEIENEHRKCPL